MASRGSLILRSVGRKVVTSHFGDVVDNFTSAPAFARPPGAPKFGRNFTEVAGSG